MAIANSSIVAPVRALELPTPKGLFWFDRKNCWSSKIGYHISASKKRVRSQQYYSGEYTRQGLAFAEKHFHAKQVAWDQIVEETDEKNEERKRLFKRAPVAKPVWPAKIAQKKEASEPVPMKVMGDEPKYADPTIAEAKTIQIAKFLKRTNLVGDRRLKDGSHNTEVSRLNLALSPQSDDKSGEIPIDTTLRLSQITMSVLTAFHGYWFDKRFKLAKRTRKNYCTALWKLLNDCAKDDAFNYNVPKGAADLFKFGKDTARIAEYDAEQLKMLKAKCPPRTWTYCLLGLNCGMYQTDISHIQVGKTVVNLNPYGDQQDTKIGEVVRRENDKSIPLTRKELKKYDGCYDIFISRVRDRTAHEYPYAALHYLWPETAMALANHLSDDNEWDYALLGQTGRPLMVIKAGKSPFRPLDKAYNKVIAKIEKAGGKKITFKQFRKLGVTAIGRIGGDTAIRLYRSQPPLGDARMYQLDFYELNLTPHLKKWREELKSDGVL